MLELHQLVTAFDELVSSGRRGVMATVIDVKGSTYRMPGARMLLAEDGAMTGLVSGGCLESDLLERAKPVFQSGQSLTVHYDYTDDDDIVWGLGLGCAGVVDVLLELLDRQHPGPMALLRQCIEARKPGFMATRIDAEGSLAARHILLPDGAIDSVNWLEPEPDFSSLDKHPADCLQYENGNVLIERIDPRTRLVIFGAGPDVVPLARMADALGWLVEVYDHRPANIRPDLFPPGVGPELCRAEDAAQVVTPDYRTAIVLMTHHYPSDRVLLSAFADSAARYIGALGPKRRTEMMLDQIDGATAALDETLFAPTGLDIGGEAPADIALAITAEIQSVFNDRRGGFLRARTAPIHERRD